MRTVFGEQRIKKKNRNFKYLFLYFLQWNERKREIVFTFRRKWKENIEPRHDARSAHAAYFSSAILLISPDFPRCANSRIIEANSPTFLGVFIRLIVRLEMSMPLGQLACWSDQVSCWYSIQMNSFLRIRGLIWHVGGA